MILGCEPMSLNAIKNSWLYLTWITPDRQLKALDAMKSLELWMSYYEKLQVVVDMGDSQS